MLADRMVAARVRLLDAGHSRPLTSTIAVLALCFAAQPGRAWSSVHLQLVERLTEQELMTP